MLNLVLVHPQIPPNTGNVIRLAANTGCRLHLIEPLGFSMEDRQLQRAGLDYHEYASVQRHADWSAFLRTSAVSLDRCFAFSTRASTPLAGMRWQLHDTLVFGNETAGLDESLLRQFDATRRVRLPMRPGQRSLNLSNAVAVAVFDAWRQWGYEGGS